MRYQSIIFDLDGTLIDSAQITGRIIDEMLAERGVMARADRDLIKEMDAVGGKAMIAAVMGDHSPDPAADLEEFRSRHREIGIPEDVLFPGVCDALDRLRSAGVDLAICSNKPQYLCDRILRELGVDHHFTAIVGSAPNRPRKPDPASALLALGALGSTAAQALYCGDSIIDVETAKAAGLDMRLVAWGYGTAHARKVYPDLPVTGSLTDLFALVQNTAGL